MRTANELELWEAHSDLSQSRLGLNGDLASAIFTFLTILGFRLSLFEAFFTARGFPRTAEAPG
jgi:hypothetical protein